MGTHLRRARRRKCALRHRPLRVEELETRRLLADLASDFESTYGVGHATEVQVDAAPSVHAPAFDTTSIVSAGDYEPSDILVRFRTDAPLSFAALPLAASSETLPLVPGLQDVHLASGITVDDALATYRARPDVL